MSDQETASAPKYAEYENTVQKMKELYPDVLSDIRAEDLGKVFDSIETGLSWIFKKYSGKIAAKYPNGLTGPGLRVAYAKNLSKEFSGIIGEKIGEEMDWQLLISPIVLGKIVALKENERIGLQHDDFSDATVSNLTMEMYFEMFAVQEGRHYLDLLGITDVIIPDNPLMPHDEGYVLQQHELVAETEVGDYLESKYGKTDSKMVAKYLTSVKEIRETLDSAADYFKTLVAERQKADKTYHQNEMTRLTGENQTRKETITPKIEVPPTPVKGTETWRVKFGQLLKRIRPKKS